MSNRNNFGKSGKNFAQRQGAKAARQIAALAAQQQRPERQEPQRTENIRKMAAVYDNAVFQRVTEEIGDVAVTVAS
jgi:ribosomal protein S25